MVNPNTNCLEGMRCPQCGSYGPFQIEARTVVLVEDDGTEFVGAEIEWDNDSFCACPECEKVGVVADFTVPVDEEVTV